VADLCRGRIVRVEVLDPQDRNPKCRPAVIVIPTEDIRPDGEVVLVAITSSVNAAPAERQVALPWHAQGQAKTRLTKPSVAVCDWVFKRPVARDFVSRNSVDKNYRSVTLRYQSP
jgi:mRNA-degrading endonuclease toxin of MazEF toxin-antitoxin module